MIRYALLASVTLAACPPSPRPPPAPPPLATDAATAWLDTYCGRSCGELERLSCPEARPTPKGHTCLEVCGDAERNRVFLYDTTVTECPR